jgi:hypothetical protein|tara:strand:+ start:612 stop:938 length:327 start_codon:yes stop_codon:yes gene_type:complete
MSNVSVLAPRFIDADEALVLTADFLGDVPQGEDINDVFFKKFQDGLSTWISTTDDGAECYREHKGNFDLIDLDPDYDLCSDSFVSIMSDLDIYGINIKEVPNAAAKAA